MFLSVLRKTAVVAGFAGLLLLPVASPAGANQCEKNVNAKIGSLDELKTLVDEIDVLIERLIRMPRALQNSLHRAVDARYRLHTGAEVVADPGDVIVSWMRLRKVKEILVQAVTADPQLHMVTKDRHLMLWSNLGSSILKYLMEGAADIDLWAANLRAVLQVACSNDGLSLDVATALGRVPTKSQVNDVRNAMRRANFQVGADGVRPGRPGNFSRAQLVDLLHAFKGYGIAIAADSPVITGPPVALDSFSLAVMTDALEQEIAAPRPTLRLVKEAAANELALEIIGYLKRIEGVLLEAKVPAAINIRQLSRGRLARVHALIEARVMENLAPNNRIGRHLAKPLESAIWDAEQQVVEILNSQNVGYYLKRILDLYLVTVIELETDHVAKFPAFIAALRALSRHPK